MLSQKTKYTIRALQYLADNADKDYIHLSQIAESQNIPIKFLTIILSEVCREGLVNSRRGPDGGYKLALSPVDISYGDILRLTRGSLALVPCASKYAPEKCKNCVDEEKCRLRKVLIKLRNETAHILDSISLADSIKYDDLVFDFE